MAIGVCRILAVIAVVGGWLLGARAFFWPTIGLLAAGALLILWGNSLE
jgi:hypothetical protein